MQQNLASPVFMDEQAAGQYQAWPSVINRSNNVSINILNWKRSCQSGFFSFSCV
jgi:hypothetical protein